MAYSKRWAGKLSEVFTLVSFQGFETSAFNSSGLKSVFEKVRFRDGLVWTVGLTGKNKAALNRALNRSTLCKIHWHMKYLLTS